MHAATGRLLALTHLCRPGCSRCDRATVEEASSTALFKAESDCTGDAASLSCEGYWESYCRFRIVPFFTWLPTNGERHPIPIPKPAASIGPGADFAMNAKSDVRMPPESIWTIGELRNTGLYGRFQTRSADQAPVGDAAIRRNKDALEIRYCSKPFVRIRPRRWFTYDPAQDLRKSQGNRG